MDESLAFGRYTIVGHDVRGYGRLDGRRQERVQSDLKGMIDAAAGRAGLDRARWSRQESGDGEMAILPRSESELVLVDDYVRHLAHRLRLHNLDSTEEMRLGIRLVIHHGPASGGALGSAGDGVVHAARLLNGPEAHEALTALGGDQLLVVLSETVFETSVRPGHTTLDPTLFRRVPVRGKEAELVAYFFPPVASAVRPPASRPLDATKQLDVPEPSQRGERSVTNVIENATVTKAVFGFEAGNE